MDAPATLAWMREHGDLLRDLVTQEAVGLDDEPPPASDPGIRAHLRFLAAALEATADAVHGSALAGFAEHVPRYFDEGQELYDRHLAQGEGAMALETHLQWGSRPGLDPSVDIAQERRIRLFGWMRLFLFGLEDHAGPAADGLADRVIAWFDERQRELGRMVVALDLQAQGAARRAPGGPLGTDAVDQLGQAVLVQAYVRHLATGLCEVLDEETGAG